MKKIRIEKERLNRIYKYLEVISWIAGFILINIFIKIPLTVFTLIIIFTIYLLYYHSQYLKGSQRKLSLILLIIFGYLIAYSVVDFIKLSPYNIPAATIPMLTVLLFPQSAELALLLAFLMSIICGLVSGGDFVLVTIFLIGGVVASCAPWQARRRSQIVWAGFLVGLAQFFALAFFNKFRLLDSYTIQTGLILFANGLISCGLVMLLLPMLEALLNVVTNISLLEYSDMNHPLIKKMILEAPGTYHHSLIVGNLAEAAAQTIGANALLARVGSYYHDIGKLEKPTYFSENQQDNQSAHEILSPSMSRLVIMNHVKDGVELAKKYHLRPAIIDFIAQHHGKSLVYFFYRRALEKNESGQEIKEEPFRYPGPKPQTKETAIVLLADSVEAVCRSIEEPIPARIEEAVRKMINNKFIDGQLDECELTLKDLEKIAEVFIRILSGIYHSRVEYPDQDESNHKKSSKQNSNKSSGNHKDFKNGLERGEGKA